MARGDSGVSSGKRTHACRRRTGSRYCRAMPRTSATCCPISAAHDWWFNSMTARWSDYRSWISRRISLQLTWVLVASLACGAVTDSSDVASVTVSPSARCCSCTSTGWSGRWAGCAISSGRVRARVPVVLTREEVERVLGNLTGTPWLVAMVLYGGGLRLLEGLQRHVKDVDLARRELRVRDTKGGRPSVGVAGGAAGALGTASRGRAPTASAGCGAWCWESGVAQSVGRYVSGCGTRLGVAVGGSGRAPACGSGDGRARAASSP